MAAPSPRRRLLCAAAVALLGPPLAGCSRWAGPTVITLDEAELAERVGRAFPQTRRVLEVLEVELSAPQLRLLPETNRLALALWLRTRERVLGLAGHGALAFDCALRYEPRDASLRLTQVRVQQLSLAPGAGPATPPSDRAAGGGLAGDGPAGARLGPALAERVLEDLAIYRLGAEQLERLRRAGLVPGAVTVTSRGVEVTLQRGGV